MGKVFGLIVVGSAVSLLCDFTLQVRLVLKISLCSYANTVSVVD